ncbi:MAG: hypothetical protein AAFY11_11125 [Cyanobacteria bacterium J06641_5]
MNRFIAGIAFGIIALTATTAIGSSLLPSLSGKPQSWQPLAADDLNDRIDRAIAAEAAWPQKNPVQITLQLFGENLEEVRSAIVEMEKNRPEGADAATVNYIRDGFLDDSVRGDWHQLELQRLPDRTWRVRNARVARRCWRGLNAAAYRSGPCP